MSNNNQTIRKSTYTSDTVIIIIGVLSLIFIIIYIYQNYKKMLPTPTGNIITSTCPDYWESIGEGQCKNVNGLGTCSKTEGANIMDFNKNDVFTNENTGNYAKCKWAKSCNVAWGTIDRLC